MTVLEEAVTGDHPVQLIGDVQVLTMVVLAALCMTGTMDQPFTGVRALIMAGLGALIMAGIGVLNMVDIAGIELVSNIINFLCSSLFVVFLSLIYILLFIYSRSPMRRSRT